MTFGLCELPVTGAGKVTELKLPLSCAHPCED